MAETQQLVIVRRSQFATFALLAQAFADEPSVPLIWDWRLRERRRGRAPSDLDDRRRRDRRSDASKTRGPHDYLLLAAGERLDAQTGTSARPDLDVGELADIRDVGRDIESAINSDLTVLISGGDVVRRKSLADQIHRGSNCGDRPLIVVERDSFIEVFGPFDPHSPHDRPPKSGSPHAPRAKWIDGGTVLIEEVADLSWDEQAELSRLLERRAVRRHDLRTRGFREARIVSGTSHWLFDRIASGEFREDLFYQLNAIHLVLPSGAVRTCDGIVR